MEDHKGTEEAHEKINRDIADAAKRLRDEFQREWEEAMRHTSAPPPRNVLESALELNKKLDRVILAQKQKEEGLTISGNAISGGPYITDSRVTKASGIIPSGTFTISPQTDTAMMKAQEEWLEKTQHMRVVALNEACGVAKECIRHGESVSGTEIVRMAHMFASFLIDGKS